MSGANALPAITLDELERLIRILGRLGSEFDGEALAAGRMAQKWVVDHQTDWRALLTPEEAPVAVTGVGVAVSTDAERIETEKAASYQSGYRAGLSAMAAQVKAQARYTQANAQANTNAQAAHAMWAGLATGLGAQNASAAPPGSPYSGGLGAQNAMGAQNAQGSVRAPAGPHRGPHRGAGGASWQAVAKELLDRDGQGIPGVFRGSRERDFVSDVLGRGFASLTTGQETWLRDIAGRSGLSW